MKVLFLCRGNVGRSVFGEGLYNNLTKTKDAFSAGTKLSGPEETLKSLLPRTEFVIETMKEEGLDVSNHVRRSVTPEMVNSADIIIDMSEQETVPDFVKEHLNRIVWKIDDPKGTDIETHRRVKDEIKSKIIEKFLN